MFLAMLLLQICLAKKGILRYMEQNQKMKSFSRMMLDDPIDFEVIKWEGLHYTRLGQGVCFFFQVPLLLECGLWPRVLALC